MAVSRPRTQNLPPPAQEHAVPLAAGRLDELSVAGLLERQVRVPRGHHRIFGVHLIRAGDLARPGHRHCVAVARAALGHDQVVPLAAAEQVRALGRAEVGAAEDIRDRPDEALVLRRVLLEQYAREEGLGARAAVHAHVDEPLSPVGVVEERRVEAAAVQEDRLAPRPAGVGGGDEVVGRLERRVAAVAVDVGVDQVEEAVGLAVAQARRPDAGRVQRAVHVELRGAGQRVADQLPMRQVARVMDRHARPPLEARIGNVEVLAPPADRRVRMKAAQDWIADRRAHTRRIAAALARFNRGEGKPSPAESTGRGEAPPHIPCIPCIPCIPAAFFREGPR